MTKKKKLIKHKTRKGLLDKQKVYNRLTANTNDYIALDPFGLSTGVSAIAQYMLNNDSTVSNAIKDSKQMLQAIERDDPKLIDKAKKLNMDYNSYKKLAESMNKSNISLEDAKDIYLGMPQRSNTFSFATESPSMGQLTNAYKSNYLSTDKNIIEKFLIPAYHNIISGTVKGGDVTDKDWKAGDIIKLGASRQNGVTGLPVLGRATVGVGVDPKRGPYVSYYDKWDVQLSGESGGKDNVVSTIVGGVPFDIYDRIYLDEYYGTNSVPEEGDYYGRYLPEIIVKNK